MLRFSGPYSEIPCDKAKDILAQHKDSWKSLNVVELDKVCSSIVSELKQTPELEQLFNKFLEFVRELCFRNRIQRHSLALELFVAKSFESGASILVRNHFG